MIADSPTTYSDTHALAEYREALTEHAEAEGVSSERIAEAFNRSGLTDEQYFLQLMRTFTSCSSTEASMVFYWVVSMNFPEFEPEYFVGLYVLFGGENGVNLANLVKNSPHVPDVVPMSTVSNFKATRKILREEGVAIESRTLLALCYFWSSEEILQFFIDGETDYERVIAIRKSGAEDVSEVRELMDNLPPGFLDEFFS